MARMLTQEQVNQVVKNTIIVLLARPDLLEDWHANLYDIMIQAQRAALDDEAFFVAAVLALLRHPTDTLPTGTSYDAAWEALITGLQTGIVQPASKPTGDTLTLDQLLTSVVEALVAVMTELPDQKPAIVDELRQIRTAALEGDVPELVAWLDDAVALLEGAPVETLGKGHQGLYATYWSLLTRNLRRGD